MLRRELNDGARPAGGKAIRRLTVVATGLLAAGALSVAPADAVAGGSAAVDGSYGFVAKINGALGCTGALIDAEWVITAKSCFGTDVVAGAPATPVTATIGKASLSATIGHTVNVVQLVPHADRDVVLARLALPVFDVAPIAIAATPVAAGNVLRVAGFGRTTTEWVPDRFSTTQFKVDTVAPSTLAITGTAQADATTCKGDAGGPAFRENGGTFELVGINLSSWQHGCYTESETRIGTTESRVDDLASWVAQSTAAQSAVIKGKASGQCLDQDYTGNQEHPTVQAWQCWTPTTGNQQWTLVRVAGADTVQIVNKLSGKCLDQAFANNQPTALVQAWQCWTTVQDNQRWVIQPHYEDNTITLVNKKSGQCLDQTFTNGTAQPAVQAWQCWNPSTPNQRWARN
ncbi:trypsin-like serine protease [Amycolatopsis sp. NPDC051045]|uniref:trypsin-like serine protease n=1 Tax=Amycolatopsis sp. NPDC051045 TaxID=3156922 RepID=UPI0034248071